MQQGCCHSEVPQVFSARQEPKVPERRTLLDGVVQQETVQPPAAGDINHLIVLSGLVDSLSFLIKSLSPVSPNGPVNTVPLAPIFAVNPSAAAVSVFPPINMFSQHVPGDGFAAESLKELTSPETLQTAVPVRYIVPEVCMEDAMPCDISHLG